MELLYSNILPLGIEKGQETIMDAFQKNIAEADGIEIAVGYVSQASLEELAELVDKHALKHVCLNIGMYFTEGMPESSYNTAMRINTEWQAKGIGEIRLVKAFKYHGKVFCFYKKEKVFAAIMGSANLGVIKLEASNRRQYEVSSLTTDDKECTELETLVLKLKDDTCSANIKHISGMKLLREVNTSLQGISLVNELPKTEIKLYEKYKTSTSFLLELKVPSETEKFMDDNKHYTKSNLNVCYAAPRSARKPRDWFETQITVSAKVYKLPGYPEKNKPFFAVTDDGYLFKVHTTSDNNKQFSAVGDELILGRWIKGRLAAAGLVKAINDTAGDTARTGMITKEMFDAYGARNILITKTTKTALDSDGKELDVWLMDLV